MRIIDIRECTVPISRYSEAFDTPAQLTTSIVAVVTELPGNGGQLTGYGFTSIGRFAQGGLIRERFAPRLLNANPETLLRDDGTCIDPFKAWSSMMQSEKPGGHGERCVAIGALDMAIWDVAAKACRQPLHVFLAKAVNRMSNVDGVEVYAGGGYRFPDNDLLHLKNEALRFMDSGFRSIKIGSAPLTEDLGRIETCLSVVNSSRNLAVDAMNMCAREQAMIVAKTLAPLDLRWFEDICDSLDYETHRAIAETYAPPISAGEALFSLADAGNLLRYARLRSFI